MTFLIGRPPKEPSRQVVVRMPESLYAELMLLKADELLTPSATTKYGALTSYFLRLVREDLEKKKDEMKGQAK